jgi:hypothetical protein
VPAYPHPPITKTAKTVKMKTGRAWIRWRSASENCPALGRALHRDVSRCDPLLLKIFMAANDKGTRCAKATHMRQSRNHRHATPPGARKHRQSLQSDTVNSSRGPFLQIKVRETPKTLDVAQNRSVPHWHRIATADSDSGEHLPPSSRTPSPCKSRYKCLFRKGRTSDRMREPLFCVSANLRGWRNGELRVISNAVPRFFFPAAVWRARDVERDLLFSDPESPRPSG